MDRLVAWSCRVYARLLLILPGDVRADYTGPMTQAFGDLCRAACRERGLFGLACAWGSSLLDLGASAWSEWLAKARTRLGSIPNGSPSPLWAARSGGALVLVTSRPAQAVMLLMLLSLG